MIRTLASFPLIQILYMIPMSIIGFFIYTIIVLIEHAAMCKQYWQKRKDDKGVVVVYRTKILPKAANNGHNAALDAVR